jgi:hypothetical protein
MGFPRRERDVDLLMRNLFSLHSQPQKGERISRTGKRHTWEEKRSPRPFSRIDEMRGLDGLKPDEEPHTSKNNAPTTHIVHARIIAEHVKFRYEIALDERFLPVGSTDSSRRRRLQVDFIVIVHGQVNDSHSFAIERANPRQQPLGRKKYNGIPRS